MMNNFIKWAFPAVFSEKNIQNKAPPLAVRMKYDAAQTTVENSRHWAMADGLSADGSATPEVRRVLRNRARYETANNSYAKGLVLTLAATCIGTGPRLQFLSEDEEFNSIVEAEFEAWSESVCLAEKLQTLRMAKITDGEGFAAIVKNPKVKHAVEIDIRLIEADRITSPPQSKTAVDGIEYDDSGNPVKYYICKEHPGDSSIWNRTFSEIPAEYLVHWFRCDRPGQSRGLPEIMPALPLFAQLRRYTLAVLAAAETAADFAAVLYTDAPANGEAQPLDPLDVISLEKRMATVMPDGWKLGQIKAEQPATSYAEFKREILGEIGRCLQIPVNIVLGDSSRFNYASGRLDHQTFFKSIKVEQSHCEQVVLYPLLALWYREAVRTGLLIEPKNAFPLSQASGQRERVTSASRRLNCGKAARFFWDGMEHVDPIKEAKAAASRIDARISNLAIECAKTGLDWEDVLVQAARERMRMLELGLTPSIITETQTLEEEDEETETDEPDAAAGADSIHRRSGESRRS